MNRERRDSKRVWADISVQWHGLLNSREGSISDMSLTGCFILTGGEVSPGELVSVEIDLPGLLRMQLWGKVVYHIADMGFALRFKDLSVKVSTSCRLIPGDDQRVAGFHWNGRDIEYLKRVKEDE